jgi:hypothetical protein
MKAIIAIVGAGITAALGIVAPGTELFQVLTVVAALVTAAGVYLVPNAPTVATPAKSEDTTL